MSLSLLQGYSSAEEEEQEEEEEVSDGYRSTSDESRASSPRGARKERSIFDHPKSVPNSLLPSAFAIFSEVAGPPEFLNNAMGEDEARDTRGSDRTWRGRGKGGKTGRDSKDLPAGAVVEAKAHLVGIRDRVRSDVGGSDTSASSGKPSSDGPRLFSATNPEPKDTADLLRMCVSCGVPKTYSHNRGMVCPVCGDRPPPDPNSVQEKKRGTTVKDKEKSKRMKGQSSHATWKSETEMQLRQQFD